MRHFILIALILFTPLVARAAIDMAALPKSYPALSTWDVTLYAKIFDLQEAGEWVEADKVIHKLSNSLLMGHVLAERYLHPTDYKASFEELREWLKLYGDHPQSNQIYVLASNRRPEGNNDKLTEPTHLPTVAGILGIQGHRAKIYKSTRKRTVEQTEQVNQLIATIRNHVDKYEPTTAMSKLNSGTGKLMDDVEYDQTRALIAAGYLYAQKMDEAHKLAVASRKRSGKYVPLAYWVEGLAGWHRGEYGKAAFAFEKAAESAYASGWLQAAASYWAARSYMRSGDVKSVTPWLKKAAKNPRTFYGLLATRSLGQYFEFDWSVPTLTMPHIRLLEERPQGMRAKALIDVGQYTLAEEELKAIDDWKEPAVSEALLAYADKKNLAALQLHLGNSIARTEGQLYDGALFPLLPWLPDSEYKLDKALVHAFIRQESRFKVSAQSPTGATGLMQIMPATAAYIADDKIYETTRGKILLKRPMINLSIGQDYLQHLLELSVVDNDLLFLCLAYNAGPGKLGQWKKERTAIDDPLLFIETIPYAETRAFVERVMANYWIYQMRLGEKQPSLDALAAGDWAKYSSPE